MTPAGNGRSESGLQPQELVITMLGTYLRPRSRRLWSGGVDWTPLEKLRLSLSGRGQSSYFLSSANAEGKWGRMTVFDASAAYQIDKAIEVGIAVKNLGSDDYEYVWWDGAQSLHSPAAGRNVTASIRVRY